MSRDKKKLSKSERKIFWISGSAIAFLAAFAGVWQWLNATPEIHIPTPQMPQPNGYDFFIAAGEAYVPANPPIALHPSEMEGQPPQGSTVQQPKLYSTAEKEAWLKRNSKTLAMLRRGLKYPAQHPAIRSAGYQFPHTSKFRRLAQMLVVESRASAEQSKWKDAADSALDCIEFGHRIPPGGPLVVGLRGIAVQSIGLQELRNVLPRLDAQSARQAAARMEQIQTERPELADILQEEKWATQASLLDSMKQRNWRQIFAPMVCGPSVSWKQQLSVRITSKQTVMQKYMQSMDALIANAQQPYLKQQPDTESDDVVIDRLVPYLGRTSWAWTRMETGNKLVMTMLALHAFKLEQGRYPAELNELVPEYLKQVPTDPYGEEPLRYRPKDQQYTLWSIGPDGVDDGGKPIINPDETGRNRFLQAQPTDKGDVVADINHP